MGQLASCAAISANLCHQRSAHRLKELNLELRQRASHTIGIDVFLSREEKAIKESLWPKFKAAKEAGQKAPSGVASSL